jgi:hypothetical protein
MTYSGNKLFNLNNIILVLLVLFVGFIAINSHPLKTRHFNLVLFFFVYLANAITQAFYFEITQDELIVKNYILPILSTAYNLSDITEIKILSTTFRSIARARLKIIRHDKVSFGFKGASLRLKDWQGIVNDLGDRKINVTISDSYFLDKIEIPEN